MFLSIGHDTSLGPRIAAQQTAGVVDSNGPLLFGGQWRLTQLQARRFVEPSRTRIRWPATSAQLLGRATDMACTRFVPDWL